MWTLSWERCTPVTFGVAVKAQRKKRPHRNAGSACEAEEDDEKLRHAAAKANGVRVARGAGT